jgi:hypothetical protein
MIDKEKIREVAIRCDVVADQVKYIANILNDSDQELLEHLTAITQGMNFFVQVLHRRYIDE